MSTGIRLDRMKNTLERNRAHSADREHQAWLASLTPTHRRAHDRQPAATCMECVSVNVQGIGRQLQESVDAMRARGLRAPEVLSLLTLG